MDATEPTFGFHPGHGTVVIGELRLIEAGQEVAINSVKVFGLDADVQLFPTGCVEAAH